MRTSVSCLRPIPGLNEAKRVSPRVNVSSGLSSPTKGEEKTRNRLKRLYSHSDSLAAADTHCDQTPSLTGSAQFINRLNR